MPHSRFFLSLLCLTAAACGSSPSRSPAPPEAATSASVVPVAPAASQERPLLPPEAFAPSVAIPDVPVSLVERPSWIPAAKFECHIGIAACRSASPSADVEAALGLEDLAARRLELRTVDGCDASYPGAVRAVRADLEPDCADYMAESYFKQVTTPPQGEVAVTLSGLRIAAWFRRVQWPKPPPYSGKATVEAAERFIQTRFTPWLERQEQRLAELEELRKPLPRGSYADAVAATELFRVRRALQSTARGLAISAPIKANYELRRALYGALDQRLEHLELVRHYTVAAQLASDWGLIRHPRALHWASDHAGLQLSCLKFVQLPARPSPGPGITGPLAHWFQPGLSGALQARIRAGLAKPERRQLSAAPSAELASQLGRMYLELGLLYPARATFERASWYLAHSGTASASEKILAELLASGPTERADWIAPRVAPDQGCVPLDTRAIESARAAAHDLADEGLTSCNLMLLGLSPTANPQGCPTPFGGADPLRWQRASAPEFSWLAPDAT